MNDELRLLKNKEIDFIALDGFRNAAGGIYATRVYEFALEIQREFAKVNGIFIPKHQFNKFLNEIPDNIEWEIDEYDGVEHVEEVHRKCG